MIVRLKSESYYRPVGMGLAILLSTVEVQMEILQNCAATTVYYVDGTRVV